jgi:hypothetical protein
MIPILEWQVNTGKERLSALGTLAYTVARYGRTLFMGPKN